MKRWVLLGVMGAFVAVPLVVWVSTLASELPAGAYLYDAGQLFALVGFVYLFFQYVFSSRIKWIERDIGLDKLFGMHRTSGLIGLTLIVIHPSFLFLADLVMGYPLTLGRGKIVGATALALFVVVAGAALLYRRLNLKYETWKAVHWAAYVALPLGFLHSTMIGSDLVRAPLRTYWFVLAVLYVGILAYKLWVRIQVRRRPFQVAAVVQETHDVWSLHFDGPRIAYKPGQFLSVRLIRDGHVSESHPFTLSSSPTWEQLSISVKAVGDFTSTIRDTQTTDRAYIDAPYGAFSYLNHDAEDLVFIAGGIGITPFMSMLRYMHDRKVERNVTLIWGNKSQEDIAFGDELAQIGDAMPSLRVVHVMSSQGDWPGEKGYVTTDLLRRHLDGVENAQVYLCGPPIMMRNVIVSLRELGVPKQRIHYERFALR
jgi:predicted ferric reductase